MSLQYTTTEQKMYAVNVITMDTHTLVGTRYTLLHFSEECKSCGTKFRTSKVKNDHPSVPIIITSRTNGLWVSLAHTDIPIPTCYEVIMKGVLE